jgi:hypothetical protein
VKLARKAPWYAVPLGIFLVTRLVDVALIVLVARDQIPASALPPHMPMPTLVDPASYFHVIANWDGQWYRQIATHGYPSQLPTHHGVVEQNPWAFYPVYPALVGVVMLMTGASFGVAASLVSLVAGAAAMCLLHRMLTPRCGEFVAGLTVLAICSAPAAPIFQAAYTEGIGLLLLLTALWCMDRRRYGWLMVTGLLLSLTRPITAPLAVVVAVTWWLRWRARHEEPFSGAERWRLGGSALALLALSGAWPIITGLVVGDTSAYADTQTAWRGVAGNRPDTWLGSLLHGAPAGRWVVVVLLIVVFAAVAWYGRCWTPAMRVWTFVYPVFILTATPPTSSIFRYGLLAGASSWPLPGIGARLHSGRARVALCAAVLILGLALQYLWLEWYLVITPASKGHP